MAVRRDRKSVVTAAAELADREGLSELSLSRVAADLGLHVSSLYNHVDGLDGLRLAVATRALEELGEELWRAALGRSGTDALVGLARAYRGYILEHPERFKAVLVNGSRSSPELGAALSRCADAIEAVMASLGFSPPTPCRPPHLHRHDHRVVVQFEVASRPASRRPARPSRTPRDADQPAGRLVHVVGLAGAHHPRRDLGHLEAVDRPVKPLGQQDPLGAAQHVEPGGQARNATAAAIGGGPAGPLRGSRSPPRHLLGRDRAQCATCSRSPLPGERLREPRAGWAAGGGCASYTSRSTAQLYAADPQLARACVDLLPRRGGGRRRSCWPASFRAGTRGRPVRGGQPEEARVDLLDHGGEAVEVRGLDDVVVGAQLAAALGIAGQAG